MSDMIQIRWPDGWRELIDKARGDKPVAEFVRDCVAPHIGTGKKPPPAPRGRGRPKNGQLA